MGRLAISAPFCEHCAHADPMTNSRTEKPLHKEMALQCTVRLSSDGQIGFQVCVRVLSTPVNVSKTFLNVSKRHIFECIFATFFQTIVLPHARFTAILPTVITYNNKSIVLALPTTNTHTPTRGVQNRRKAAKASKKQPSQPLPTMDQRSFELIHDEHTKLSCNEVEDSDVMSLINGALHKKGTSSVRVERIRCTDTCRILGATTPNSTLQDLLKHRDLVLKTARAKDSGIRDVVPQQKWR